MSPRYDAMSRFGSKWSSDGRTMMPIRD